MTNQSDQFEEIVGNLRQPSAWVRIVFMLGFALVLYLLIAPVILIIMIAQALFSVITGTANANLRYLGGAVAKYVFQILEFVSYNSEIKPFPFSDFPSTNADPGAESEQAESSPANDSGSERESTAEETPAAAQPVKAARKKTTRKKTAKKKTS